MNSLLLFWAYHRCAPTGFLSFVNIFNKETFSIPTTFHLCKLYHKTKKPRGKRGDEGLNYDELNDGRLNHYLQSVHDLLEDGHQGHRGFRGHGQKMRCLHAAK
jgi:hypothetical protein